MELQEAFPYYKMQTSADSGNVRRIMRLLYLDGIRTIEQLCELVQQHPEKVREIRGIGSEYAKQIFKIVQFFQTACGRKEKK